MTKQTKQIQRRDAVSYNFTIIYDLNQMLTWLNGKTKAQDIILDNAKEAFDSFTSSVRYVDEAIEFQDGTILTACTTSEFAGTFASHDDVRVRYFALDKKS